MGAIRGRSLSNTHRQNISRGLRRYYEENSKFVKTRKGPRMELRQKKAVLLSLLRKRRKKGSTKKLEHEIDKIGRDIRRMNRKLRKEV